MEREGENDGGRVTMKKQRFGPDNLPCEGVTGADLRVPKSPEPSGSSSVIDAWRDVLGTAYQLTGTGTSPRVLKMCHNSKWEPVREVRVLRVLTCRIAELKRTMNVEVTSSRQSTRFTEPRAWPTKAVSETSKEGEAMTVGEAMRELAKYSQHKVVVCKDDKGGWDNIEKVESDGSAVAIVFGGGSPFTDE